MDREARSALEELSRRAVAPDLDALSVEIDLLRRELLAIRQAAGVPYRPPDVVRREHVVALRRSGLSTQAISSALGVARKTVQRDLRVAAAARPNRILGLDGRLTRGPRPPADAAG